MAETYTLADLELESPLIAAAGAINGTNPERVIEEARILSRTAVGALTGGSTTILPQAGNEAKYGTPVYHHDSAAGRTYNCMDLPNPGLEVTVHTLIPRIAREAHDRGKVVIWSGSPAAESPGSSVDQAVHLARTLLDTDADLVELNLSCPNDEKPILGYDLLAMHELFERLADEVGPTGRLGAKLPPYLSARERQVVPYLADLFNKTGVFRFLTVSNSVPNQVPRYADGRPILSVPSGAGGMSGPATAAVGQGQLEIWQPQTKLDKVSLLGVGSGRELYRRLQLGAVAGGGVTFLWQRENWGAAVTDVLDEFVEVQD